MTRLIALVIFVLHVLPGVPVFAGETGEQFTTFAGFQLGTVTLSQVERKYGRAKLVETGDAGEYQAAICYTTNAGLVHFLSGEMGGRNHKLLGFAVSGPDTTKPCSPFPASEVPPSLELAGLRLGMTKAEFARIVAASVQWEGYVGRVVFESRRPIAPEELATLPADLKQSILAGRSQNYFDVAVSVVGTFSGEWLTEFRVWKVETL